MGKFSPSRTTKSGTEEVVDVVDVVEVVVVIIIVITHDTVIILLLRTMCAVGKKKIYAHTLQCCPHDNVPIIVFAACSIYDVAFNFKFK